MMPQASRWAGLLAIGIYSLCVPASNWLVQHVGVACSATGPCLVPVAPGILAPSGVLLAGLALVLRDFVQRFFGLAISLAAILGGVVLTAVVAPPALVWASAVAFGLSELADAVIFTPIQRRGFLIAVAASAMFGLVVDSLVFLYLAFGSLDHLAGQIIGKTEMVILSLVLVKAFQRAPRSGAMPHFP